MTWTYYNDSEPFVCNWLENLIREGLLPVGEVDRRPIQEVTPDDVRGFTQAHFFAGIGGWAYALRLAGWPDDRPVWTSSCPCQPFSAAGKGQAQDDPRHLWPEWFRLIRECHPPTVFGEQVAAAVRHGWLDLVCGDLEGEGYACGSAVLGAHSVGAPHIRQRLWFVADAERDTRGARRVTVEPREGDGAAGAGPHVEPGRRGVPRLVAHAESGDREISVRGRGTGELADAESGGGRPDTGAVRAGAPEGLREAEGENERRAIVEAGWFSDSGATGELAHGLGAGLEKHGEQPAWRERPATERSGTAGELAHARRERRGEAWAGESGRRTRGYWEDADWLPCRDGKARPVEPGTFPLAHGVPARVGRLRAYGNAINPYTAAAFVRAYMEVAP